MERILNISFIVLLTILYVGCKKPNSKVYLSGTIKGLEKLHNEVNSVTLDFVHRDESVDIQNDSSFSMEIVIDEPTYASFTLGKVRNKTILLKPRENLVINIDFNKNYKNILSYGGSLAEYCNKLEIIDKYEEAARIYDHSPEDEYVAKVKKLKSGMLQLLDTIITEPEFLHQQKVRVENDIRAKYINYKRMQLRSNKNYQFSDNIFSNLKLWTPEDEEAFKYSLDFQRYVFNELGDTMYTKRLKHSERCYGNAGIAVLGGLKDGYIKDRALQYFHKKMLRSKIREEAFDFLISNVQSASIKEHIVKTYKGFTSGEKVIPFRLQSYNGDMVSLEDFKGKYVCIDIWSSSCYPCLYQLPYLDTIEQKFHNRNIEFVSISVDQFNERSIQRWKAAIDKHNMKGTQLISNKMRNVPFMRQLNVSSIPHFILIDPKGCLVEAYAPRPSDPRLIELLESQDL